MASCTRINFTNIKKTKEYPKDEIYGLTQQLRRAIISIELNIAEGTSGSKKQFIKHLIISLGSCKETECCLILSKDLGYIQEKECEEYIGKARKIQGMLSNLIKTIANS